MLEFLRSRTFCPAGPLYKVKEPSRIHGYTGTIRQDIPLLPAAAGEQRSGGGRDPGGLPAVLLRGPVPGAGAGHPLAVHRGGPPTEPLPEDLPGPELPLEDMALRAALETLSETEQELVVMRYVNQEPVGVIAAHLGMSRFAVYRRTAAALEKLRRALKEDEP